MKRLIPKIQEVLANLYIARDSIENGKVVPCSEKINAAIKHLEKIIKDYYK